MTTFIGSTGKARFMDGMWEPQAAPSIAESAKRAGAAGDGSTLVYSTPSVPGYEHRLIEKPDALGNSTVNLFSVRKGSTPVNPDGPHTVTQDSRAIETAQIVAINARNKAYWDAAAGRKP